MAKYISLYSITLHHFKKEYWILLKKKSENLTQVEHLQFFNPEMEKKYKNIFLNSHPLIYYSIQNKKYLNS